MIFYKINSIWDRLKTCPPHIPGNAIPMDGVMTDWNPAEIIGTSPGELVRLYKYLVLMMYGLFKEQNLAIEMLDQLHYY